MEKRQSMSQLTREIMAVKKVKKARNEEAGVMKNRGIWTLRSVRECWEKTGKLPVSVRWVHTNKGN